MQTKKTKAILVNPTTHEIQTVMVDGHDGIEELMLAKCKQAPELEGNELVELDGGIDLFAWEDHYQYLIEPSWVTTFNSMKPMHGLTLIVAYDRETGEAVNCPVKPLAFARTIEWEVVRTRVDPKRPNKE
jgi:hypothetical protein